VVGVQIMQVSLILTATSMVREKENNTLELLIVSSLSRTSFIAGKILPYVVIAFIDFYLVLLIGAWLFDLPLPTASQGPLLLLALTYVAGLMWEETLTGFQPTFTSNDINTHHSNHPDHP
jgi:ABC-2 type transport system permease protein